MSLNNLELLQQMSKDIGEMHSTVKIMYRSIEGNGQPGLRQRVELLEKSGANNSGRKAVWAIVISAALTLSTMVYHIYQDWNKTERTAVQKVDR